MLYKQLSDQNIMLVLRNPNYFLQRILRILQIDRFLEIEMGVEQIVETGEVPGDLGPEVTLPAIKENDRTISGLAAISAYLKELEKFVSEWRRFQSDSCDINDEGETC